MSNETYCKFSLTNIPVLAGLRGLILGAALAFGSLTLAAQTVNLSWDASTNSNVIGYVVFYGTDGVNFPNSLYAGGKSSAEITNLTAGATNYFEIEAYDGYNFSAPSAAVNLYVPGGSSSTNSNSQNIVSESGNSTNNGGNVVFDSNNVVADSTLSANTNYAGAFSLQTSGDGSGMITPNRTVSSLKAGKTYTVSAVAAKGSIFTGWVSNGVVVSTSSRYSFEVEPNLTLSAVFVPNPFIPVMGAYHGLFYVNSNATAASSGSFTATVLSTGVYSAKVRLGAATYSFTGAFDANGVSTKSLTHEGGNSLGISLQLGVTNGPMTGIVSNGVWVADLVADFSPYSKANPAPQAGKYTLIIPGGTNSAQPIGNGFGAVTVSDLGAVTVSGTLADGTTFNTTSVVNSEGQWPFYVTAGNGANVMLGWLSFTNQAINGPVGWFKTAGSPGALYPNGFSVSANVLGSAYTNLPSILGYNSGSLLMTDGNLSVTVTNQVTLSGNDASSTNGVKLVFHAATGIFTGTVPNPATGKSTPVGGAVLQNQGLAAGCFLDGTESGALLITAAQ